MDKLAELFTNPEQQLSELNSQQVIPQFLTDRHMARLWTKMTRLYGHKWSSIAESDDGTWLEGLRGLSPDQVAKGLGNLVNLGYEWPPSLPEFKKLCLDIDYSDLESFILGQAFPNCDGFYMRQQSQQAIDRAKDRVRERATREYLSEVLAYSADCNAKLLEKKHD